MKSSNENLAEELREAGLKNFKDYFENLRKGTKRWRKIALKRKFEQINSELRNQLQLLQDDDRINNAVNRAKRTLKDDISDLTISRWLVSSPVTQLLLGGIKARKSESRARNSNNLTSNNKLRIYLIVHSPDNGTEHTPN